MAKIFYPKGISPINCIDGYWKNDTTYGLCTPHGLVIGIYCDEYLSLDFVYKGFRYRLAYEQVKTQKYAAILTKRFYYGVINNN